MFSVWGSLGAAPGHTPDPERNRDPLTPPTAPAPSSEPTNPIGSQWTRPCRMTDTMIISLLCLEATQFSVKSANSDLRLPVTFSN